MLTALTLLAVVVAGPPPADPTTADAFAATRQHRIPLAVTETAVQIPDPPPPGPSSTPAPPVPQTRSSRVDLTGDALAVADCESGQYRSNGTAEPGTYRWDAVHGDLQGIAPQSTASGAFQFLDGTWTWVWTDLIGEPAPTARARDASPADQLRAFEALWDGRNGSSHWSPSRSCWQPRL
ncbi:MAG: hypothetical protein ABR616_07735 [Dermatophilaceae bacterium]